MNAKLPPKAQRFAERHPEVWEAYRQLGKTCAESGPLGAKSRRLVKLALAVGAGSEGAVHSHVRRALEEGIAADELRHVATLAVSTLGLSAAVAALTWMEDLLAE